MCLCQLALAAPLLCAAEQAGPLPVIIDCDPAALVWTGLDAGDDLALLAAVRYPVCTGRLSRTPAATPGCSSWAAGAGPVPCRICSRCFGSASSPRE